MYVCEGVPDFFFFFFCYQHVSCVQNTSIIQAIFIALLATELAVKSLLLINPPINFFYPL